MRLPKFFELLYHLKIEQLEDLAFFIQMPSLSLTKSHYKTFNDLIEQQLKAIKKGKKVLEEEYTESYTEKERKAWNRMKSIFSKVINQYIGSNFNIDDNIYSQYQYLSYYNEHQLTKNYNALSNTILRQTNKSYNDEQLLLEYVVRTNFIIPEKKVNRKVEKQTKETIELLDEFYFINKLRLELAKVNAKFIFGKPCQKMDDQLSSYIITHTASPIVHILYDLQQLLLHPENISLYHDLHKRVLTPDKEITFLLKEIIHVLMNYSIYQLNGGYYDFGEYYLKYIQYLDQKNLLLENKQLEVHHFHNYITIALVVKDYKLAEKLIKEKSKFIIHEHKDFFIKFNRLRLQFYQGTTKPSKLSTNKLNPIDSLYHIQLEKIEIKILLHDTKGNKRLIENRLHNLRKYLNKNFTDNHPIKVVTVQFVNCTYSILNNTPLQLDNFRNQLAILDYYWFKEVERKQIANIKREEK